MQVIMKTKQGNSLIMEYTAKECEEILQALNISKSKDATTTIENESQSYTVKSNDIVSVEFIY